MNEIDFHINLKGQEIGTTSLDAEEKKLLARVRRRYRTHPDWTDFGNYWTREVAVFYDARGLTRSRSRQSAVYRIAQDLWSRLGIATGFVRPPDCRAEVENLIRLNFPTRRAFCEATGLSEDMLSHFLAGRKDLSLASLSQALTRVGYRLGVVPTEPSKRTG